MTREWELKAACRDKDPDLFFSGKTRAEALSTCHSCVVRGECLTAALAREKGLARVQRRGIVAGLTGAQRFDLALKQGQGRAG
ncbi:WhiB family transcriptional regulator [Streptomyces sp. CC224B]|uniref:WhiB family transcriptional regulator n=1 Tax=Streptomyces sp. CC224B TaxID=3044571 RepID=UPI0024A9A950|nr:WhiB family transcriptional regulator [Streptomyces sp. CC224B]